MFTKHWKKSSLSPWIGHLYELQKSCLISYELVGAKTKVPVEDPITLSDTHSTILYNKNLPQIEKPIARKE